jgi:class 3 adenylate cyclase
MDIAAWLRELGLEQYEQAFRDNAIDVEVLPDVTDADLAGLGVLLGHRRKLLRAAATLRAPAMVEREASPGEAPSSPLSKMARTPEAERRQLTVLFCDLVGSTELAAQLDPEDMGAVLRAYQDTVAGEITRFEGHIAKYMGDGVLAYFGWPIAHEDDAERAVRAGLAVTAALTRLAPPAGEPLAARVGIATGMVMVGQMIGEGAAQEQTVVGGTPNLAARLQGLAAPGSAVISQATRRLVGGLFELADLGPQCLKGFAEPIRAWRLVGISAAESRFEAMHSAGLTPLIGREHELGLLLDRWERAKNSEGQVVLLSGEPGIGKSRITQALHERLAAEPHLRLRYHCSPYHVGSALFPVIDQLERAAGLQPEDTAEIRLDKLETVLSEVTENINEVAPVLAALLWIPTGPRYPPLNLMPEAQKARTFEVLLGQLVGLAARQPVLMVLEDAHWIDPTSAELFGLVMDRIQRLPVLLLMTFRPEFAPPWTGYTHATSLTLSRLGQRQGAQMVERLTSGKPLPPEVLEQILAKTDGVPLFVEELTKTVLESGLLADAGDHFELAGPVPALAIPATLHDSLVARLDRLAPVKEVAQIGAVIGREFPYDLLSAVAPMSANQLGDALEQLVSSELVFRRGTPPGATYTFKHALVQDAAYQSLLNSKRQQLHASIAQVLQQQFPDVGETQPEVLAQHFTEAGLGERAIAYWRRAGELAVGRSANVEAIAHLNKGLELLGTMPDAPERAEENSPFVWRSVVR